MTLETLTTSLLPTAVIALIAFLARDKLSFLTSSLEALVGEVKELRKELAEVAVLRVRLERCELEIGELRDRMHSVERRTG